MATISESLAGFASALRPADLPAEVVAKAKALLMHNLACAMTGPALLGSQIIAPAIALARLQSEGARWSARLWQGGQRVSPADASFANGAIMHAQGRDDFHGGVNAHPGAVILPAILGLAEADDRPGDELLAAMVAGYEVMIACGDQFSERSTPRGFRSTCLYGPLGAAAAASRILCMDAPATASAIGLAANFAGGLTQPYRAGTFESRIQCGEANRAGTVAALLAREGMVAAPDTLEGQSGFYRAYTDGLEGTAGITAALGRRWRTIEVSFKLFPISGIMQLPVSMVAELSREHDLSADKVERVRLELTPLEYRYPGTADIGRCAGPGAAAISARFLLAAAIRHHTVTRQHLAGELDDPVQLALMARIDVVPVDDLPQLASRIIVQLHDGRMLKDERMGGAALAWGLDAVSGLAGSMEQEAGLPKGRLEGMIAAVSNLESRSARELVDAIVQ